MRDIGWAIWDPIGLLDKEDTWEGEPSADEYDSYLLRAAYLVRTGTPEENIIDYLMEIESVHMALATNEEIRKRAKSVIDAIRADKELWS